MPFFLWGVMLGVSLVPSSATAFAGSPGSFDWPKWQGPERNAVSRERGLLYVLGLGGDLACLQVRDGKTLWQHNLSAIFTGCASLWTYRERMQNFTSGMPGETLARVGC